MYRLAELDADSAGLVRVINYFDALVRHGLTPDVVIAQPGALPLGLATAKVVEGDLADPGGRVHDPVALGVALASVAP